MVRDAGSRTRWPADRSRLDESRSLYEKTRLPATECWLAQQRPPELYPDAVTLVPGLAARDVLRAVRGRRRCFVKDSFLDLGLSRLGFDELFRARWIFREPNAPVESGAAAWSVVDSEDGLEEWTGAADLVGIIRSELLAEPSVRVVALYGPDGLAGGGIANRTGSVVGVSNVFTTTMAVPDAWAGIVHALATLFPSLPQVGYERGESLESALAAGFSEIGRLRVWLRPAPANG